MVGPRRCDAGSVGGDDMRGSSDSGGSQDNGRGGSPVAGWRSAAMAGERGCIAMVRRPAASGKHTAMVASHAAGNGCVTLKNGQHLMGSM